MDEKNTNKRSFHDAIMSGAVSGAQAPKRERHASQGTDTRKVVSGDAVRAGDEPGGKKLPRAVTDGKNADLQSLGIMTGCVTLVSALWMPFVGFDFPTRFSWSMWGLTSESGVLGLVWALIIIGIPCCASIYGHARDIPKLGFAGTVGVVMSVLYALTLVGGIPGVRFRLGFWLYIVFGACAAYLALRKKAGRVLGFSDAGIVVREWIRILSAFAARVMAYVGQIRDEAKTGAKTGMKRKSKQKTKASAKPADEADPKPDPVQGGDDSDE